MCFSFFSLFSFGFFFITICLLFKFVDLFSFACLCWWRAINYLAYTHWLNYACLLCLAFFFLLLISFVLISVLFFLQFLFHYRNVYRPSLSFHFRVWLPHENWVENYSVCTFCCVFIFFFSLFFYMFAKRNCSNMTRWCV